MPRLFLLHTLDLFLSTFWVSNSLAAPVDSSTPNATINATECDWRRPNDLINQVLEQQLNVTDIVLRCPEACRVIYGSGNPVR